jgi:hypothetical protein
MVLKGLERREAMKRDKIGLRLNAAEQASRLRREQGLCRLSIAVAAAALSYWSPFSSAQVDTWTGASGNWSAGADWSDGVPAAGDDVLILDNDGVSRTVNYDYTGPAVSLGGLRIGLSGGNPSATNILDIAANNLAVAGFEYIGIDGTGSIDQSGGTNIVTMGSVHVGGEDGSQGLYALSGTGVVTGGGFIFVGGAANTGTGAFYQSGGTVSFTNITPNSLGGVEVESGTYSLSAGTMLCCSETVGGNAGTTIVGPATFIQTGGSNSVGTTKGALSVGGYNTGAGSYLLNAGTLYTPNGELIGEAGTFTQNGGTNTMSAANGVNPIMQLLAGGTYALNAGTLSAVNIDNAGVLAMTGGALTAVFAQDGSFAQSGGNATFQQQLDNQISLTGGELTLLPNGAGGGPADNDLTSVAVGGSGVLNLVIGGYTQGVNYDWEHCTSSLSLGGTLDLDLSGGFVPNVGDHFTIMSLSTGSISGAFSQLTSDDPGLTYTVSYPSDEAVEVTITSVPEPVSSLGILAGLVLLGRWAARVSRTVEQ